MFATVKKIEKEKLKILTTGPRMSDAKRSLSEVKGNTSSERATTIKIAARPNLRIFRTHHGMFDYGCFSGERIIKNKTGAYMRPVLWKQEVKSES